MRCLCHVVEPMYCGDCDAPSFPLTEDEAQDVLSALAFFISDYPDHKGSVITRAAMKRISNNLWTMMRALRARGEDDEETKRVSNCGGAAHGSKRVRTTGRAVKRRQALRGASTKRNAKRAAKPKRNAK